VLCPAPACCGDCEGRSFGRPPVQRVKMFVEAALVDRCEHSFFVKSSRILLFEYSDQFWKIIPLALTTQPCPFPRKAEPLDESVYRVCTDFDLANLEQEGPNVACASALGGKQEGSQVILDQLKLETSSFAFHNRPNSVSFPPPNGGSGYPCNTTCRYNA
jgi:hypothetical protein